MIAAADPGSMNNLWGFMGVAVTAITTLLGVLAVARKDRVTDRPKAPERVELETAYGVPTDDVSDMAIALIFAVRQELQQEKKARKRAQGRVTVLLAWARDVVANWDEHRLKEAPPELPEGYENDEGDDDD